MPEPGMGERLSSVRRALWLSVADNYLMLALQVASTVVIARVLTPAQIGVFAIGAVFSSLASMFRDFGVAEYLIQERDLTREKIASTLALNIIVSWLMAAAMFLGAPWAASFYGQAELADVMRVQALGFLIVPFGAVTMAWFRRELIYGPSMVCNVAGNVTGFVISVSLALLGHGPMSLAWSTVGAIAVTVALSQWYRPRELPRWPSFGQLGHVFHFSKFVSLMYIIGQAGKGAPELIIGKAQGVTEVAIFSRGNGLVELFNRLVLRSAMLVSMPYFAKSDRDDGSMLTAYGTCVGYLTLVGWPLLALFGLLAYPAVRIVYGPQWDAAVPLAQVLCLAFAIELVHSMSREALLARGLAKRANQLQLVLVLLQVLGLLLVVPFGLIGAAWGVAMGSLVGLVVTQLVLRRALGLSATAVIAACRPSFLLTALVGLAVLGWLAIEPPDASNFVRVGMVGGALGLVVWVVAMRWIRPDASAELLLAARAIASRLRETVRTKSS